MTMTMALVVTTLTRMVLYRSTVIRGILKVTPGASSRRITSSHRDVVHTPVWAQKDLQKPMISPQMSMSLNRTLGALTIVLNIMEKQDTGTVKAMPGTIIR